MNRRSSRTRCKRDPGPRTTSAGAPGCRLGAAFGRFVGMTAWAALGAAFLPAAAHAGGDAGRGERVFQYCYSCHSVDPNETAILQGPSLVGIVGRRIAGQEGFEYSPAMRAFAAEHGTWSEALLDRYVAAPLAVVPQTTMAFRGVEEAQERADLIAYLASVKAR
jgi:cytochrome c